MTASSTRRHRDLVVAHRAPQTTEPSSTSGDGEIKTYRHSKGPHKKVSSETAQMQSARHSPSPQTKPPRYDASNRALDDRLFRENAPREEPRHSFQRRTKWYWSSRV